MAGIYSQGGSAGHRYAGWLSEVEAKNFTFGGNVFNGSPSAIYVGSNLVWTGGWLKAPAVQAILGAFGQRDGMAVINATNAYLNQLAASDRDKATALAGFINEDPMMVCSLGLQVEGVTMPIRFIRGNNSGYFNTGINPINGHDVDFKFATGAYPTNSDCAVFLIAHASWAYDSFALFTRSGEKQITYHGHEDVFMSYTPNHIYRFTTNYATGKGTVVDLVDNRTNTLSLDLQPSSQNGLKVLGFADTNRCSKAGCIELRIDEGNTADFLPLIRNEQVELIDIVSGNLADRHGSFTIEYTLPDGTPWTPLNQQ